jgi:hypothetical protein
MDGRVSMMGKSAGTPWACVFVVKPTMGANRGSDSENESESLHFVGEGDFAG